MIKYRPHRGSLADAMAEAIEFETVDQMKSFICASWYEFLKGAFTEDDIVIGEILGDDDRIGWKNVRHVCVTHIGSEHYAHPQCIGWCGE